MRRLVAVAAVVFVVVGAAVPVGAQTVPAVTQRVAFVVRVPQVAPLDDPSTPPSPSSAPSGFVALTRSLARWSEPPLEGVPVAIAVSPALCEELTELDPPAGRPLLRELRKLAQRAEVLSVPYADVWLPFLASTKEVEEQLTLGSSALHACLGRRPSNVLFGHVLHTGDAEPVADLDDEAVAAARDAGIETIVGSGPSQTPVRTSAPSSKHLGLIPFSPFMPGLDDDGSIRGARPDARVAIGVDAVAPTGALTRVERLATSDRVTVVNVADLVGDAPEVAVAFPDDPRVDAGARSAAEDARTAVDGLGNVLERTNVSFRTRLKASFAHALAQTSKDEDANRSLETRRRSGRNACERLVRYVERELDKITVSEGSVTFTSRRGSVPVTVSTKTTYPVRVRVSVQSPKLQFEKRIRSRTVTIEPPGDTITFAAIARSSGTFLLKAAVKDGWTGKLKIDETELTVRSTAANLPVLILTIAGALLLLVMYVGRVGRRRREQA